MSCIFNEAIIRQIRNTPKKSLEISNRLNELKKKILAKFKDCSRDQGVCVDY